MLTAVMADAGHPVVAGLLGLGAAGLAAAVVVMAWSVHIHQIRLAEQLARRQFLVTPEAAPAAHAVNGHGNGNGNGHGEAAAQEAARPAATGLAAAGGHRRAGHRRRRGAGPLPRPALGDQEGDVLGRWRRVGSPGP